jgi:hypothetical protein
MYKFINYDLPLVRILSQINPVQTTPSYFFKIYFNIKLRLGSIWVMYEYLYKMMGHVVA